MAVLSMKRIEICALQKDKKELLSLLQRKGLMEISLGEETDNTFKEDTAQKCAEYSKGIADINSALEILKPYCEEKQGLLSSLAGRTKLEKEEFDRFEKELPEVLKAANEAIETERAVAEGKAGRIKLSASIAALEPFINLDVPLACTENGKYGYLTGSFGKEYTLTDILCALAKENENLELHVEILSVSKNRTCVFVLFEKEKEKEAEAVLRAAGFEYTGFNLSGIPAEEIKNLEEKITESQKRETQHLEKLKELSKESEKFLLALDVLSIKLDKAKALASLNQTEHALFISGYIPSKYADKVITALNEKFELYVEACEPEEDEDTPVMLENNGFSAPVTGVLNAFGLPGKGEIDPVGIMSIFYYVLFGLMFSDAGYGLIMALICGFVMIKYRRSDAPIMQSVKMFFWCGVSTALWGVVLGSFFGDALEVISQNYLSVSLTTPTLWFAPLKEPMKMLVFTMAIGIVHMYTGLVLAGYQHVKAKRYADCIYDVVSWLLLVTALIFLLMGSSIFEGIAGFKLSYLPWQNYLIYGAALLGALIIILTAGRESKSPFKRLLKGLYGLYNVTGWLGDVISYSRLLALGLATGVVASVINQMGAMIGNFFVFIIVFVFGHTLNFAINVLGAYVHCNRLQFVEFFGRFYEGGGKEFTPLKINTKNYTIMEDK